MVILCCKTQRPVEINQFGANAVASTVGHRAAIVGEPGHGSRRGDRRRRRRRRADRIVLDAKAAGDSDLPPLQKFAVVQVVEGADDGAGVEVFVVVVSIVLSLGSPLETATA